MVSHLPLDYLSTLVLEDALDIEAERAVGVEVLVHILSEDQDFRFNFLKDHFEVVVDVVWRQIVREVLFSHFVEIRLVNFDIAEGIPIDHTIHQLFQ